MEDVYSFVDDSKSFQNKVEVLENTISKILEQTVKFMVYIHEYTGHGFRGYYSKLQPFPNEMALVLREIGYQTAKSGVIHQSNTVVVEGPIVAREFCCIWWRLVHIFKSAPHP
jgi:hypothetical protein